MFEVLSHPPWLWNGGVPLCESEMIGTDVPEMIYKVYIAYKSFQALLM